MSAPLPSAQLETLRANCTYTDSSIGARISDKKRGVKPAVATKVTVCPLLGLSAGGLQQWGLGHGCSRHQRLKDPQESRRHSAETDALEGSPPTALSASSKSPGNLL